MGSEIWGRGEILGVSLSTGGTNYSQRSSFTEVFIYKIRSMLPSDMLPFFLFYILVVIDFACIFVYNHKTGRILVYIMNKD